MEMELKFCVASFACVPSKERVDRYVAARRMRAVFFFLGGGGGRGAIPPEGAGTVDGCLSVLIAWTDEKLTHTLLTH